MRLCDLARQEFLIRELRNENGKKGLDKQHNFFARALRFFA